MPIQDALIPNAVDFAIDQTYAVAQAANWTDLMWYRYTETDLSATPDFAQSGDSSLTGIAGVLGYDDAGANFSATTYAPETNLSASLQVLPTLTTGDFIAFIHGLPSGVTDTNFVFSFGTSSPSEKYIWFQLNDGGVTDNLYFGDSISIGGGALATAGETMVVITRRGDVGEYYRSEPGGPVALIGTVDVTGFDMTSAGDLLSLHGAGTNDRATYHMGIFPCPNGCPSQAAIGRWFTYMRDAALAGYKLFPKALVDSVR